MNLRDAVEMEILADSLASNKIWGNKWSSKYILEQLVSKMQGIKIIGLPSAKLSIDLLNQEHDEFDEEVTVHLPITNLMMEIHQLQIGAVTFHRSSSEYRKKITGLATEVHQNMSPVAKETFKLEDATEVILRPMRFETSASFVTVAEPILGIERALTEVRRTLEILTLACSYRFPDKMEGDIQLSIFGEIPHKGPSITYQFGEGLYASQESYPSSAPMNIVPESLQAFDRHGITDLFELLQKPLHRLNDIESALLRSIHWFAVSQGQLELENRLLNLTTAIESLLTVGEQYSITSRISEGSAVLLMSDYDSFVSTRDFMQQIYKARSNVSHGGHRVTTLHEIHRLRNIATELIM